MSDKGLVVKRLKDMTVAELQALPTVKAVLARTETGKKKFINFSLTLEIGKDFNHVIRLTEEQFANIKLLRKLNYDVQNVFVYARISKGVKVDGTTWMMLEVVAAPGIRFNELLTGLRANQVEQMIEIGTWNKDLQIHEYPNKVEDFQAFDLTTFESAI